jgi:hypothetical protein
VRRCLDQGLQVYPAEWTETASGDAELGLEHYVDRLLPTAVDAVAELGLKAIVGEVIQLPDREGCDRSREKEAFRPSPRACQPLRHARDLMSLPATYGPEKSPRAR